MTDYSIISLAILNHPRKVTKSRFGFRYNVIMMTLALRGLTSAEYIYLKNSSLKSLVPRQLQSFTQNLPPDVSLNFTFSFAVHIPVFQFPIVVIDSTNPRGYPRVGEIPLECLKCNCRVLPGQARIIPRTCTPHSTISFSALDEATPVSPVPAFDFSSFFLRSAFVCSLLETNFIQRSLYEVVTSGELKRTKNVQFKILKIFNEI